MAKDTSVLDVPAVVESTQEIPYGEAPIVVPDKRVSEVRSQLNMHWNVLEDTFLKVCELLHEASLGKYYLQWQVKGLDRCYETFEEFVELEFNCKLRKAQYFISIHEMLVVNCEIDQEKLTDLGWSKCRELATCKQISKENIEEWIEKAQGMSWRELVAELKKLGGGKATSKKEDQDESDDDALKEEEEKLKNFKFKVTEVQMKVINRAIELCKKQSSSDAIGYNLELICCEFITSYEDREEDEQEDDDEELT